MRSRKRPSSQLGPSLATEPKASGVPRAPLPVRDGDPFFGVLLPHRDLDVVARPQRLHHLPPPLLALLPQPLLQHPTADGGE